MDKPNSRSLHIIPTVRGGGFIFIGLSLLSIPLVSYYTQLSASGQWILMTSIFLLALIGFLDDLYSLTAKLRLLVQCIVAFLVIFYMQPAYLDFILFSVSNQYVIVAFLFFTVIWAINHFNFMDGLDGFCASQALFLLAAYTMFLNVHSAFLYQYYCMSLIICLLGFLWFNFPPAKLFMGDVGSATLGFISIAIAVIGQEQYDIPIAYWFMLNSLFLLDATVTLVRRMINKEEWFAGHKKHAYQRLKQSGVDSYKILLGQTMINVTFLFLLLFFQSKKLNLGGVIFLQLATMLPIYYLIEKRFPMYPKHNLEF
jgi:UDP-N-acetylmuramyl pentapeptide phosphotransferase/UDP-N-acetylglucosamine-1-phosphate transferase